MNRPVLWVALFVSLALNVFVVGAFVGARLSKPQAASAPVAAAGPQIGPRNPVMMAVRTLSPESQAAWRGQGADLARTMGPKAREARQLARQTMAGFGDPAFDVDAALANLQRARALEHENRVAMDRRLVAFAASLPPEERAKFAEALSRPALRRNPAPN